ncbi:MAG: hypothetical protein HF981_19505 [Desulfobacteraceae bacterium]|nr:hypothetical protein [Desulfobacteraceae bacterium]MBC2752588.1 hypothetical protein [Desulfobacteraceae bacterium]
MNSRELAKIRRAKLDRELSHLFSCNPLSQRDVRKIIGQKAPSAFTFIRCQQEFIVAVDENDRKDSKVKYELDVWGFVFFFELMASGIKNLHFIINTSQNTDIRNEKWFVLFLRRISYLKNQSKNEFSHKISLLNHSKLSAIAIPAWSLENNKEYLAYLPEDLPERNPKSDRNREHVLQWKIMENIKRDSPKSLVIPEFPCQVILPNGDKKKLSIDLIDFGPKEIRIIEVKHGDNKDLDAVPQTLDYFIFINKTLNQILKSRMILDTGSLKSVHCYLAAPMAHPLFEKAAKAYSILGFKIEFIEVEE